MGYNKDTHNVKSDQCVADIVRGIVKAQHRAVEVLEDSCATSCERSIEDLLSPSTEGPTRSRHNTIPFILYCKGTCKPFVGSGVSQDNGNFECFESPIFRVRGFVGKSNNCVRLELLTPESNGGPSSSSGSVCDLFPASSFQATGICITVDLNAFFGISCLDPITVN